MFFARSSTSMSKRVNLSMEGLFSLSIWRWRGGSISRKNGFNFQVCFPANSWMDSTEKLPDGLRNFSHLLELVENLAPMALGIYAGDHSIVDGYIQVLDELETTIHEAREDSLKSYFNKSRKRQKKSVVS
eukprot:TRINITY_DN1501_c0_g1_i2.p1 TRINITY_DN1501_c0_g1~~TRINITY_DN1501_c0_g1_i2.p1  ORF type:complete len:130 (-),score=1.61 TRINITY_DN1501_c0_g1_i2:60-449(-)